VNKLDTDIKNVKGDIHNIESNVNTLSKVFDSVKDAAENNTRAIAENRKRLDQCSQKTSDAKLHIELSELKDMNTNLMDSVTNLKVRFMRENLVFTGIEEDRGEDTEAVLQYFIEISFERVHCMGKWNERNMYPGSIVAKCTYFKEREVIRTRAPRKLKGSNVWVNETYPPEIEGRRKKLYPVIRQAKRDGKLVRLVKDMLYIDGVVHNENRDATAQLKQTSTPML
jgi:hypothetical protein